MSAAVFIGDELTACGFRLGGFDVHTPEPGAVAETIRDAVRAGGLIMISAGCAESVPRALLDEAGHAGAHVLIVPDALGNAPPDLAYDVRRTLGLE